MFITGAQKHKTLVIRISHPHETEKLKQNSISKYQDFLAM
jgi:hypothetical protein